MEELVSIVVPVFNTKREVLKKCLECLIDQSYQNIEIIVVDDCSNNSSIDILTSYNDKRIKVFVNEKNNGVSFCRNRGIDNSKGEYIIFIDSDDYCDKNLIKYLYEGIKKYNKDVAVPMTHRCVYFEDKLVEEIVYNIVPVNEKITKENYFKFTRPAELYEARKLYKASLLKDVRFDTKCSYGQTLLFNFELSKKGFTTCFIPEAIYFYNVVKNSNSGERRLNTKGWYLVEAFAKIIRSKEIRDKDAIVGLYNEFDFAFNLFYYALARKKKIFRLFWMNRFKFIYLRRHHGLHDLLYMLFPILIVSHREKKAKKIEKILS